MKIILEPAELPEPEVIIRGDVGSEAVSRLLHFLQKKNSGRLIVYREEEQYLLEPEEIVFLEVCDNRVRVHTSRETYESRMKLYELKTLLAGGPFAQISKSVLVNIGCVRSIQAEFSGNYRLKLKDRKEVLTISRKYFKEFRDRI